MTRFNQLLGAGALFFVAATSQAQLSSTITATSDYDFRGFSQSAKDPALQASLDYAFSNGIAIGAWASNVDFDNDADIELDYYASYTGTIKEGLSWSIGGTFYSYPGSDDTGEYPEFFVGLGFDRFSIKQWYSNKFYDTDRSAQYTEVNGTFPLQQGFSLLAHAGYSWGDFWEADFSEGGGGGELFDYSIGVGYDWNHVNLNLKVTGTDASGGQKFKGDVFNNEPRLIFSVATTLPWGKE
jgi:uncharacterized protein (TIGR02001 family)